MDIRKCGRCSRYSLLVNGICSDCLYKEIKKADDGKSVTDRFQNSGTNQLTVGHPSVGRTNFTIIESIRDLKSNHQDMELHIIDPHRRFDVIKDEFGAKNIHITDSTNINPFEIPRNINKISRDLYNLKIKFAVDFILNVLNNKRLSDKIVETVTKAAVRKLYEKFNVQPNSPNPIKQPTMDDYLSVVDGAMKNPDYIKLANPRDQIQGMSWISLYKKELDRIDTSTFNESGYPSVGDSSSNYATVYTIGRYKDAGLSSCEIVKMNYLRSFNNDKSIMVVVDNGDVIMDMNRRYGLKACLTDSLSVDDFSLNLQVRSPSNFINRTHILNMFDIFRMHRVGISKDEMNILNLSEKQRKFLSVANDGINSNVKMDDLEFLYGDGSDYEKRKADLSSREESLIN